MKKLINRQVVSENKLLEIYNLGIKTANRINNIWLCIYVVIRLIIVIGPLFMAYLIGELTSDNWQVLAKEARFCALLIAIAVGLDTWINPQRVCGRANRLRNWLWHYRHQIQIIIDKGKIGEGDEKSETWFLDKYQEQWNQYNQLDKPPSD